MPVLNPEGLTNLFGCCEEPFYGVEIYHGYLLTNRHNRRYSVVEKILNEEGYEYKVVAGNQILNIDLEKAAAKILLMNGWGVLFKTMEIAQAFLDQYEQYLVLDLLENGPPASPWKINSYVVNVLLTISL